jgi:hypothetical protein
MNSRFIIYLVGTALITAAGYGFLSTRLPQNLEYHHYIYILIFFTVLTAAFHSGLARTAKTGTKNFIRYYMTATAVKLLLYIAVIVIYAVINKPGVMAFALCFLLHYCAFTVFEVSMAYRQFGEMRKEETADVTDSPEKAE